MGKARDKWNSFDKLTKRIIAIGAVVGILSTIASGCWASLNHYATNIRVDMVANLVIEVKLERRIEWLEKQEVTCEEERKIGDQSSRRKANCKKWKGELDRKYKELEKLQT